MSWEQVRDLPQLWQRPSYETLLRAIRSLRVAPPTWNTTGSERRCADCESGRRYESNFYVADEHNGDSLASRELYRKEASRYLSAIVSSDLAWLEDDDDYEQRETLWAEASRALAERCGRTGTCTGGHVRLDRSSYPDANQAAWTQRWER